MKSSNRAPGSVAAPTTVQPAKKPLERLREWQGMAEGAYSANTLRAQKAPSAIDRKSTRLNSSHTVIYTLSLHDALPICATGQKALGTAAGMAGNGRRSLLGEHLASAEGSFGHRSEEHTSELQSHSDLHSFPTRRSSDLCNRPKSPWNGCGNGREWPKEPTRRTPCERRRLLRP